jgi:hypothetical protein
LGVIGSVSSSYRFSRAFIVRLTGTTLVAIGALLVLVAVLVVVLSLSSAVLTSAVLAALVAWVGVLAAMAVLRTRAVVRFDEVGYRVSLVRGAGVRDARWKDVEDARASTVAGHRCVALRLRDGRLTTIPVDVLAGDPDTFVRDLQRHLNRGHGYRPLRA